MSDPPRRKTRVPAKDWELTDIRIAGAGFSSGRAFVIVSWLSNHGFGEVTLRQYPDKVSCTAELETEAMGKDFALRVLAALIERARVIE